MLQKRRERSQNLCRFNKNRHGAREEDYLKCKWFALCFIHELFKYIKKHILAFINTGICSEHDECKNFEILERMLAICREGDKVFVAEREQKRAIKNAGSWSNHGQNHIYHAEIPFPCEDLCFL